MRGSNIFKVEPSYVAVITCDGAMLGLYTSQVDAWKVAKHIIGASMWRCAPNSDVCEVIDWK